MNLRPILSRRRPAVRTLESDALRVSAALCRAVELLRRPTEGQVTRRCYIPVDTARDTHAWVRTFLLCATYRPGCSTAA